VVPAAQAVLVPVTVPVVLAAMAEPATVALAAQWAATAEPVTVALAEPVVLAEAARSSTMQRLTRPVAAATSCR